MAAVTDEGFDYVVKDVEAPKVAFGSGKPREVLPPFGTTKFSSTYPHVKISHIGPSTYYVKDIKCIKREHWGYGGLARTDYRCRPGTFLNVPINTNPGPGEFEVDRFPKTLAPRKAPFNVTSVRCPSTRSKIPGPGTYHITKPRDRRIQFDHSFGGAKTLHPAVDIKCDIFYTDLCAICNLEPIGDYWHLHDKEYLCRPCMETERKKKTRYKQWQLDQFKKIRDCSFMHHHELTYSALITMEPKVAKRMLTTEAYISQYFP